MALSAAFSMAMIIIGVANTCGSIASLNWLARCAGVTRSVNVPFAPGGIVRMRQYSHCLVRGHAEILLPVGHEGQRLRCGDHRCSIGRRQPTIGGSGACTTIIRTNSVV